MVDRFAHVFPNINQFYMAGLMAAPMLIIELLVMGAMYQNKKLNAILIIVGLLLMAGFFMGIRTQAGVSDKQFLKSMIPHHAGAILMCEQNDLKDPELRALCEEIRSSQQKEIDLMKAKLTEINDR